MKECTRRIMKSLITDKCDRGAGGHTISVEEIGRAMGRGREEREREIERKREKKREKEKERERERDR